VSTLDIAAIRALLPHRYPFLLVDRILEQGDNRIVGIKNVTVNEPFFTGHFPGFPVMPGVLIIEAMAQVAGVMVLAKIPDRDSKLVFLAGVDGARFRRPVVPGDQLRIEVQLVHGRPTRAKLDAKAYVDGQLVAEASLMCVLQDRGAQAAAAG
jgi:beta-hydroxyacyl-ACP dehydratase FabZ